MVSVVILLHMPVLNVNNSTFDKVRNKMDYSGTTLFSPRLHSEHKANVILAENETTKSKWEEKEHETGSRYSELMKLPYFDCVRCTIIDPMHNLFTGTAKHMLKNIWLNDADCRINGNDMKKIQEQIDQFRTPSS